MGLVEKWGKMVAKWGWSWYKSVFLLEQAILRGYRHKIKVSKPVLI